MQANMLDTQEIFPVNGTNVGETSQGDQFDPKQDENRPKRRMMTIAAIPCYNEGVAIGSVVLKTKKYVDQVIVIDDGSTDDTAEVATMAGAHVLRHSRNLGKGMAIRTAWLYAREKKADALALIDGDSQHNPADLPRLFKPIEEGEADVVLGFRWGKTSGMPKYRRVGKRALDYATAISSNGASVTDSQCGYRAYSSLALRVVEPVVAKMGIESQMLVEAQEKGLRVNEVPVDIRYDVDGSTYSPAQHGISVMASIVSLVSEKRPLFFFGVPGMILITMAALLGGLTLQLYYNTGSES